jgi:hypothetical protein
MKTIVGIYIFSFCLFWITKLQAQNDSSKLVHKFSLKGYVKFLEQVSFTNDATDLLTDELIHNRLNMRYQPDDHWNFRLEIRNRIYYGELVQQYPNFASLVTSSTETFNLSKNWVNQNAVLINSTIDRASAEYERGKWDITTGRQRINWGINTVWTPNDIFNTFNYFDFDYEERPGADALRAQYACTSSTFLEIALSPGRYDSLNVGALMLHFNKWNYDFQVFSGIYHRNFTAGAGWAGNIGGAGFKGEITFFTPYGHYTDTSSFSATLSVDYAFKNGIYVLLSGLYNKTGTDSLINITQLTSAALSAKNIFPFKYTAFAEASYSFTPILKATLAGMYSPGGSSIIILPSFSYSIAENWILDLVGQSFFSKQNGTYGSVGNSIYLRIKLGF